MTERADDGDLSGKVGHLAIDVQRAGYLLTARPVERRLPGLPDARAVEFQRVAADCDELAALVRRLMADPPEGGAR